jgi:hypothetical protein
MDIKKIKEKKGEKIKEKKRKLFLGVCFRLQCDTFFYFSHEII